MQLALLIFAMLALLAGPGFLMMLGVGVLIMLPMYLMFSSAVTLVLAPQQILAVAGDRTTRRAHACEHATVNVLEERLGPLPGVGGVARKDGFYIWGAENIHPNALYLAAREGVVRMRQGETRLALHPRCGTSLMTARFVFAAVFLGLLVAFGYFTFAKVLVALLASWLLGKPLGLLVQRFFTTSPDVGALEITGVSWADRPTIGNRQIFAIPRGAYFFHVDRLR